MKKSIYKSFIMLTIPIIIQQILSQSLTFIDQIMIGHLGEEVIAAVGTAGQISFFYWVVQFGILSAGSIFIAQYHGKAEHQMVRRIFGFMTGIALIYSTIFTGVVLLFGEALFTLLFPQSIKTIQIGTTFTHIIAITFLMTTLTNSFSTAMRSIERTKEPMIATSISILANIAFNALL
ncbi:MAG: MATE family efflux transporter, partial [Wohlfahrtiimonas sp.]